MTETIDASAQRSMLIGDDSEHWYKDAVIYELHVRAFQDSDNDGIGDFRGLITRLDYLQDLGVNALWLLPFYPSPLRDDGYDISDYRRVHPSYGTLRDFRAFLREAHRRGLRVITELVLAHTSDEHPWFGRARRAGPGTIQRDYYIWSDTPDRFAMPGSSSRTSRPPTGPGTPWRARTSGTASIPTSRASTTTARPCARRSSASSTTGWRWGSTG